MRALRVTIFVFITLLLISACRADQDILSLFPLEHYSQTISDWIQPNDKNYDKPLLSADSQQKRLDTFLDHYYGAHSPWSAEYINQILHQPVPKDLKTLEQGLITLFNNQNKQNDQIGYGENFRPYSQDWINAIANTINFSQLDTLHFDANNQAIAIDNLKVRVLPTDDVYFYNYKLAGQGYPFDNLQISSLWAGTPVYILTQTQNHAWTMVITPDFIGWVKSNGIARTNSAFIAAWKFAAKKQLSAITHTQTSLIDQQGIYRFLAYVGSVFPSEENAGNYKLMIPVVDDHGKAQIHFATVSGNEAMTIPAPATPHNFATIISTLINRPYGWGNMYFYNDCSAELKSLFTPFGIWLPRHSSDQLSAGKQIDLTSNSTEQRLNYLMENGHAFMTVIYIGGHIVLYVGNHPNPNTKDHEPMAMTYQNLWGLSPSPAIRRAVIGQSVLLPMLLQYPEDTSLVSLAGKKYFQVAYLDEMPSYLYQIQQVDLQSLMYP